MFKIALPNFASGKLPFSGVANSIYCLFTTWDETLKFNFRRWIRFKWVAYIAEKVMLYSKYYLGVWCHHNPLSTSVSKIFFHLTEIYILVTVRSCLRCCGWKTMHLKFLSHESRDMTKQMTWADEKISTCFFWLSNSTYW